MEIQKLTRVFQYNGLDLPDPNPTFSVEDVIDFYADAYPELRNGFADEPTYEGEFARYPISAQIRRKGGRTEYKDTLVVSRILPKHKTRYFYFLKGHEEREEYVPIPLD